MDFSSEKNKDKGSCLFGIGSEAYVMAACDDTSTTAVYRVKILSKTEKYALIKYNNDLTEEIPLTELLPIDHSSDSGIAELLLLTSINEASLLLNLKSRYNQNLYFTNLGKLLIHVKPPQKSDKNPLTSEIGEISAKTLKKVQKKSQTLIFVGESQTGKTFSFIKIFKCLFSYNEKFQMIKSALFIIRVFTNRLLNGKFNKSRTLVHGTIYVTGVIPDGCSFECINMDKDLDFESKKGNFAVFSLLETDLTNPDVAWLTKNSKYPNELTVKKQKYSEKFKKSAEKLQIIEEFTEITQILYGILALSHVEFIEVNGDGGFSKETIKYLQLASKFLRITEEKLKKDLISFTRTVGKSLISTKLDKYECEGRKKALIQLLYSELFKWILHKINTLLVKNTENKFISLIDYPGSQNSKINSLEELLINYTNEKFHQLSISTYFNDKMSDNINLTNNKPIIDLLENSSTGILKLLSDSCTCKSTESLLSTLSTYHVLNEYFEVKGSLFSIHHSFQKVTYEVTGLREKNLDIIYTSLLSCLESSSSLTVKSIYKPGPTTKTLLSTSIPNSISKIFSTISSTSLKFIYCLDPMLDHQFNEHHLLRQIQSFSLIDYIIQFKSTLTTSYTSPEFLSKYKLMINSNSSTQKNIENICDQIGLRPDHFNLKNKKIFISKPCEKILNKFLDKFRVKCGNAVLVVQRVWRRYRDKRRFRRFLAAICRIQALFRGKRVYQDFRCMRFSSFKIQRWFRRVLLRRYEINKRIGLLVFSQFLQKKLQDLFQQKSEHLALTCQRLWKGHKVRKILETYRITYMVTKYIINKSWKLIRKNLKNSSITKIQKHVRGYLCRENLPRHIKLHFIRQTLNKSAIKIQKHFKRYITQMKFEEMKTACYKIQYAWKVYRHNKDKTKKGKSILLIQRRVRIFLIRIRQIKLKLSEFLIRELSLFENLKYLEQSQVFSSAKSVPSPIEVKLQILSQLTESSGTLSRLKLVTSGSLSPILKDQNPFHLEKMNFFIRVLSLTLRGDTSIVYPELWGNIFESLVKECIQKEDLLMDVKLGNCHSAGLSSKGKVFVWGWNDTNQCLGKKKKKGFRFVKELKDYRFLQIACGDDHTVVLAETGEVFAFGDNSKGQLGQGNYNNTNVPVQVALPSISSISSCGNTTIALSKDSKAYIWSNSSEFSLNSSVPTLLLPFITISEISSGYNFIALLTTFGLVYTFGSNNAGQLGHGDLISRPEPTPILSFKKTGEKISKISAGQNHVLAKSTLGKLFSWGGGKAGQLGTGKVENESLPVQVNSNIIKLGKVIQVSAGLLFSVVLNENRKIFVAGNGKSEFHEVLIEDALPEFGDRREYALVRVQAEWNRMFMVVSCTVCDLRAVQKSYVKVQSGMNQVAAKWGKGIEPPIVETLAPFYSVASWRRSPLRSN